MQLLTHKHLHTITQAADGNPLHKQTSNHARSTKDLQIGAVRPPEFPRSAPRAGEVKTGSLSQLREERGRIKDAKECELRYAAGTHLWNFRLRRREIESVVPGRPARALSCERFGQNTKVNRSESSRDLLIFRGFYGVRRRTVNVTEQLAPWFAMESWLCAWKSCPK